MRWEAIAMRWKAMVSRKKDDYSIQRALGLSPSRLKDQVFSLFTVQEPQVHRAQGDHLSSLRNPSTVVSKNHYPFVAQTLQV